jgi:hypothetical protein
MRGHWSGPSGFEEIFFPLHGFQEKFQNSSSMTLKCMGIYKKNQNFYKEQISLLGLVQILN